MENKDTIYSNTDELDLRALFNVLWSGMPIILLVSSLFGIFSVYYALSIPNQYKAEVVLAPVQKKSNGGSSIIGNMSGLASIAGFSGSASGADESKITQEIMKSRDFIERFIFKNKLEVMLLAVSEWNKDDNHLVINNDIYDKKANKWKSENAISGWKLYKAFTGRLTISESKLTGFVTVSFEHFSPDSSKDILDAYISEINSYMQMREINKVTRNIEYLQNQITKTDVAQMQSIFYSLIETEIRNKMLADASPEFAFNIINPVMKPELKSKPSRAVICILITMLGAILSTCFIFIRHFLKNDKNS